MVISLRNRHFYGWIVMAILLPIGFLSAYRVLPEKLVAAIPGAGTLPAYELVEATEETEEFLINIRKNGNNVQRQVEILIKTPLTRPSTFVYVGKDIKSAQSLGHLKSKGIYRFQLSEASSQFRLLFYDHIKQEIYQQIEFKL